MIVNIYTCIPCHVHGRLVQDSSTIWLAGRRVPATTDKTVNRREESFENAVRGNTINSDRRSSRGTRHDRVI